MVVIRRALAAAMLLVLLALAPGIARADESNAEQLFQEGLAAMKREDYPVACDAFTHSNKADPSPGTQINLAICFEKRKMWASAWTWYRSAVGLAQQRKQREREQLAEDAANRLKPSLHYLVVGVKEQLTDLVVKRDGAEVVTMLGGKEVPLPVDPGDHSIEVFAKGKKPWTKTIQVADNAQTDRVDVPPLEAAPVDAREPGAPASGTVVVRSDGSTQRLVGIIVGAAGVLSGLAAVGVFVLAKDQEAQRDEQLVASRLPNITREVRDSHLTSANTRGDAADNDQLIAMILGGGALVMVGTGVILYATAPRAPEKAGRPRLTPVVGPSFAGVGLGGTF